MLKKQIATLVSLGYKVEAVERIFSFNGVVKSTKDVHNILHCFKYYDIEGNSIRDLSSAILQNSATCLEAALIAYDLISLLLNDHQPQIMVMNRLNPNENTYLGHTALIYRADSNLFAAIAVSRHSIQGNRNAVFESIDDVVLSYAQGYLSIGLKPLSFGISNLKLLGSGLNWRNNSNEMCQLQERLLNTLTTGFDITSEEN